MSQTRKRESSDPYYDLIDDFDLVVASFQSQYGIRLSRELNNMKWSEFSALLVGMGPDTPLGRIVAIRAEEDAEVLKNFTKEQNRIRNEWRSRRAKQISKKEMENVLNGFKNAFIAMAGGDKD